MQLYYELYENGQSGYAVLCFQRMLEKKKPTTSILKATTNHVLGGLLFSQQQIKSLLTMPNEELATAPQVTAVTALLDSPLFIYLTCIVSL